MTFEGTLLFALNAVGLAFVFFSHDGPPYRHTLEASGASRASVRTRTRYPRERRRGRFDAHICLKIASKWGVWAVCPNFWIGRYRATRARSLQEPPPVPPQSPRERPLRVPYQESVRGKRGNRGHVLGCVDGLTHERERSQSHTRGCH